MTRQPWHEDFWVDGDTGEPLRRRESELNAYLAADVAPTGPPLHEPADRDGDNVPSEECSCAMTESSMRSCAVHGEESTEEILAAWEAKQRGDNVPNATPAQIKAAQDVLGCYRDLCIHGAMADGVCPRARNVANRVVAAGADRDRDDVPNERVRAYARALSRPFVGAEPLVEQMARAVMAVADREQAALQQRLLDAQGGYDWVGEAIARGHLLRKAEAEVERLRDEVQKARDEADGWSGRYETLRAALRRPEATGGA